eukprot:scaffold4606_cov21-Tisochrysis_lutea.AAC.2
MQCIFEALLEVLTLQNAALGAHASTATAEHAAQSSSLAAAVPTLLASSSSSNSTDGGNSGLDVLAEGGDALLERVARQLLGVAHTRKGSLKSFAQQLLGVVHMRKERCLGGCGNVLADGSKCEEFCMAAARFAQQLLGVAFTRKGRCVGGVVRRVEMCTRASCMAVAGSGVHARERRCVSDWEWGTYAYGRLLCTP